MCHPHPAVQSMRQVGDPPRTMMPFVREANEIPGAKEGANRARRQTTQSDARQLLVQLTGISGDTWRRPATVRLHLTSEGSLFRTQLRLPGTQSSHGCARKALSPDFYHWSRIGLAVAL